MSGRNPILLIHGYSDNGESFEPWRKRLEDRGFDASTIYIGNYRTLTNEISIRDLAEGLNRALTVQAGLSPDQSFDAIVHSTGMLVVRSWLTAYAKNPARKNRLKRLIGLAPATFGSPLAHKGRSWLGSVFKGDRTFGPDFMEAGNRVLDGLELGSKFTWDLAHSDMLGSEKYYGDDTTTPYVFIFAGDRGYKGLSGIINEPGTDGTVRWAGCALNTRKIVIDLSDPGLPKADRIKIPEWTNVDIPLIPIADHDHGSILGNPSDALVEMVVSALAVSSPQHFKDWLASAQSRTADALKTMKQFQQFVIRAIDERGDPIPDYNVELEIPHNRRLLRLFQTGKRRKVDLDVHVYGADESYRCFHMNVGDLLRDRPAELWMRMIVSSGTDLVGYHGFMEPGSDESQAGKQWDASMNITALLDHKELSFFYPLTTTLIELRLNREPLPLDREKPNRLFEFLKTDGPNGNLEN